MAGKSISRSSKIKSLFTNDIFLDGLEKLRQSVKEDNFDLEVIKLRKVWGLNWDYHETITHYLETNIIDYSLGDNDIRVIDYMNGSLSPSEAPFDEFNIMKSLESTRRKGVHIKLPKDLTKTVLLDFVRNHYDLIEGALDRNYPDRITHQTPEQMTKRKVRIFRSYEEGVTMDVICEQNNCEPRYVRSVVKEFKDKISE